MQSTGGRTSLIAHPSYGTIMIIIIIPFKNRLNVCRDKIKKRVREKYPTWTRESTLLFSLLILFWTVSLDPDGGVSPLPVPLAVVCGNSNVKLLPNCGKKLD